MKKQTLLILTLAIFSVKFAMTQQLPNVSYFMYDHTRTNPGSLGSMDMVCASLIGKQSMTGFDEGAPQNVLANVDVPFNLFGAKHGVGLSFYNDLIGYYEDFDLKLGYAFRFKVADGTLGIGINGNIRQKSLDGSNWEFGKSGDPTDVFIPQGQQEPDMAFGAGFGLFYRAEDIYLGASVANIYSSEIKYNATTNSTVAGSATEIIRPHYYLTAGYKLQLSNPAYVIEPAVMLYSDGASTTFDLNATLTYNKKVWAGVTYRAGSVVSGMVGMIILDGVKMGYAYDYNTSAISQYSSGGHEVILNYCFKLGVEKSPQKYRSVRYL